VNRPAVLSRRAALGIVASLLITVIVAGVLFAALQSVPPVATLPALAVGDPGFVPTMQAHTAAPAVGGNAIELLLNGDQIFPAKLAAIRSARLSITYAEYFYAEGEPGAAIASALAERCRAGVPALILLDGVGALTMESAHRETMERAGCRVVTFRPLGRFTIRRHNNRNHRRILVVDGRVAITGGSGVSAQWMGDGRIAEHWRDTDVRVEGAVVEQLQAAFAENWQEATAELIGGPHFFPGSHPRRGDVVAQAVRSSPSVGGYAMYSLFLLAINGARRSISITNPYFLPHDPLGQAILAAVHRGVRVRILVPGVIDHALVREAGRRYLGDLLRAGVEISEYMPALLHAKTMVVDGRWATVGSTNFDRRSFSMNDELNVAVHDATFASELERVFAEDIGHARRLTYEAWVNRPLKGRIFEWLSIPLRPLL
jgi:cardiolipin synthase A/B